MISRRSFHHKKGSKIEVKKVRDVATEGELGLEKSHDEL
jgi:hypothetical protein